MSELKIAFKKHGEANGITYYRLDVFCGDVAKGVDIRANDSLEPASVACALRVLANNLDPSAWEYEFDRQCREAGIVRDRLHA